MHSIQTLFAKGVRSLRMTSDGRSLVCGKFGGRVQLWSYPELVCRWDVVAHSERVRGIITTPDVFITCGDDGKICFLVWRVVILHANTLANRRPARAPSSHRSK